ncbi:MAG TPA: 5'-3' exonuclease H3TH domain-containing protein [Vicinamibacteria bacterium]|nr:5'-3' exonuclease H3TH domain-containing protein [Vicinamibacteria bacterium]
MKVHLVDATYELFRAHFGAPPAQDGDGRPVGAVRGLLATLIALLREPEVTHVACAFDHVIESFRNDLFDGYKTGDGVDPALLAQFHPAEEAAAALGLVVWPMVHYEADDALATAAARFDKDPRVEQVVICSPDKDLAQCVSADRVICRDRRRRLDRDEAGVLERFGVRPGSIPDWLALVGDSADGIPGIPGWGEKSAGAVLLAYQRLEAIPDQAHRWTVEVRGRERLAESLAQRRQEAGLYRQLATLCREVPLGEELPGLEWRGARPGFVDLCRSLGAPELVERVPRWRS